MKEHTTIRKGYFEFSGEFEINALGGVKFNRHQVVPRSMADWEIGGGPEDKVQKGQQVSFAFRRAALGNWSTTWKLGS